MYTIGSDPEFFVAHQDIMYPAFKIISGTKENPTHLGDGYSILHDNVLIEGNIPPANTVEEFVTNMRKLKIKMNNVLKAFNCKIKESDVEIFLPEHLEHEKAKEFGCMPFTDAWTFEDVGAPEITENWRTAGFHIHVGYENTSEYPMEVVNIAIARAFDFFALLPANAYHRDTRRDNNYGGFGKFRHKPYGLELRGLSGYYSEDRFLKWAYNQTIKTVDFVLKGDLVETLLELTPADITLKAARSVLGMSPVEQRVTKEIVLPAAQKLVT